AWPGNVRELKNLAQRLVSLLDGEKIRLKDLPDHIAFGEKSATLKWPFTSDLDVPLFKAREKILQEFEKQYLINLLQKCKGNISKAARLAQISRRTMYRMINTYDLHKLV
ncbi:MAG: helix-turn-helix domain-containing protein, partial [bacterium]